MKKSVFVIDDDKDILDVLTLWFELKGYAISTFNQSKDLLKALRNTSPDIVLLDINLGFEDGRVICKKLKEEHLINCHAILMSANPDLLSDYKVSLADGTQNKPFDLMELTQVVEFHLAA